VVVVDEDTDGAAGRDLGGGVQGRQTKLVRRHVQVLHTHTHRERGSRQIPPSFQREKVTHGAHDIDHRWCSLYAE
jgi:hypothetical protein